MQYARFDDFFFSICNETGGIEGLLNSLFSFLLRRTDFFYESRNFKNYFLFLGDPGDKMGFPPGKALSIVATTFQKYQKEHYQKFPPKSREEYEKKLAEFNKKNDSQVQKQEKQKIEEKPKEIKVEQKQPQVPKVPIIDTYNGGSNDKYSWSQTGNDVTVQIELPVGTGKKEIAINIKNESLLVKIKNNEYINGKLYDRVKCDDSMWSIEDNKRLIIHLEKGTDNIWKTVIQGDQEIDATKVENTKALDDFDPETQVVYNQFFSKQRQGALRKIMYEQQRKQQGLPTTEEEKQIDMLKKAWDSEGSPFKGQPFDPSKFNLQGGNNFNM